MNIRQIAIHTSAQIAVTSLTAPFPTSALATGAHATLQPTFSKIHYILPENVAEPPDLSPDHGAGQC